jgi:N utilization substance protein B
VLEDSYALDEGPLDDYATEIALGADAMLHELDAVIAVTSDNWSVSRMPAVDRNLLRLALFEMLEQDEVDTAVAIDECVELAKAYGTDESSRFVNGVLGKVARRMEAGEDVVALALEQMAALEPEDDSEDAAEAEPAVSEQEALEDLPDWVRE